MREARRASAGFMLAPLLYMLALAGIGATVMFSGYSQILRSNAEMTAVNAARSQLQAAGQTLSASSVLDTPTSTIVQPPAVYAFASVTGGDSARLPTNYAAASSTGTPHDVGVVDVSSGVRQLDPWGKFYVYCRWENPVSNPADPALMVLSAGPDGILTTKCGDISAQGDDRIIASTVAETINRANVWQVSSSSQVKFGIDSNAVKVNQDGSMTAASLTLSGGITAASATISGALSAGSTTFTGAAISGNATVGGTLGVTGTTTLGALTAGAAALNSLTLSSALGVAYGGTGAATAAAARTNLAVLAIANNLSDVASAATARTNLAVLAIANNLSDVASAATARTNLAVLGIANNLSDVASASTARTNLGLGTMATQNADAVAITGGAISGVTITGNVNGNVSGSAGSVPASSLTGCCVPIAAGGTNAATAAAALQNLGVTTSGTPTGNFNITLLPASGVTAGTYSWGTVDAYGRVTAANNVTGATISQGDTSVSVADTGSDGAVSFTTNGALRMTLTDTGLGIGTATPSEKLDVNGNAVIRGAAATNRILYYNTADTHRWSIATNGTAEGGSNAGSDLVVTRYNDAGSAIAPAMSITRSTGDAAFAGVVSAVGGFSGNLTGNVTGNVTGNISGSISLSDGTVTSPGLYFTSDTNTGLYRPGADVIGLAGGGKDIARFTGSTSAANYFNISASATGANLGIAAAGTDTDVGITLTPKGSGNTIIASGNVGIGTTAASYPLHVSSGTGTALVGLLGTQSSGDASSATDFIYGNRYGTTFKITGFGNTHASRPSTVQLGALNSEQNIAIVTDDAAAIAAGTSTKGIFIKSGGTVGIGTASPGTTLHVYGAQGALTRVTSPNNALYVYVDDATNTFTGSTNTVTLNATRTGSGTLPKLRLAGQGGLELASDATSVRMVIDTSGNVGIGTTSPAGIFQINKDATYSVDTGAALRLANATTPAKMLAAGYDSSPDAGYIQALQSGGAYKPLLLNPNGGNVGIASTSPTQKLDVAGTVKATAFQGDGSALTGITATAAPAGSSGYVQFNASGSMGADSALFWDNTNKRLGIGTTSPGAALHVFGNNGTNGTSAFFSLDAAHSGIAIANNATIGYLQGQTTASGAAANMALQVAGGNVGIGTTSITGRMTISAGTDRMLNVRGDPSSWGLSQAGIILQGVNSAQDAEVPITLQGSALYLLGGNVGIGTTSPITALTVAPSAANPSNGIDTFGIVTTGSFGGGIGLQDGTGNFGIWLDTTGTYARFGFGSSLGALSTVMSLGNSGNLGIGTTSPAAGLHAVYATTTAPSLTWGVTAGAILRSENSELAFGLSNASPWPYYIQGRTNGSAARDIALQPLGGNVGIGTTSPGAKLHSRYYGNTNPSLPSGTWAGIIDNTQDATTYNGLSVATRWGGSGSKVFEAASYWNGAAESYTPILTVLGNQTVGIGTTSPIRALTVAGGEASIIANGGNAAYLNVSDGAGSNGGSMALIIRGLGSSGSAQVNLSSITLAATTTYASAVSATSFSGAGTGLTGTASSLTAGNVTALAGTWDGVSYFRSNKGASSTVGANSSYALEAFSSDGGAAGMSFHRGGAYAVNMGLDPDNVFRIGGWSASANLLQLDMSGNLTAAAGVYASDWFRSNGNTGWYSQSYGGGWYMSDTTWIRAVNNKYVYTAGVMRADTNLQTPNLCDTNGANCSTPAQIASAVAGGGGSPDYQAFTSSGTWTKPGSGKMAYVQCWGAGGGSTTYRGGGGGAYMERTVRLSTLGSTETVTIGTSASGTNGGNSTFGSWLTAYGGKAASGYDAGDGGGFSGSGKTNGGGAGVLNDGSPAAPDALYPWSGAGGGIEGSAVGKSIYGGGGGGGWSIAGGTSVFGGAGGTAAVGSAPGGGGGNGGYAGGRGECRVTVW